MTDAATELSTDSASEAEDVLTITRHLGAPREAVFRAWSDPSELVKWWGPEGMTTPVCEMDVRPGGAWRTVIAGDQGNEHICSGLYREIIPPERLEFTWAWETDGRRGHESVITIEFREHDGGTEMVFTQRSFESAESRMLHNEGWTSAFKCLDRQFAARSR